MKGMGGHIVISQHKTKKKHALRKKKGGEMTCVGRSCKKGRGDQQPLSSLSRKQKTYTEKDKERRRYCCPGFLDLGGSG